MLNVVDQGKGLCSSQALAEPFVDRPFIESSTGTPSISSSSSFQPQGESVPMVELVLKQAAEEEEQKGILEAKVEIEEPRTPGAGGKLKALR